MSIFLDNLVARSSKIPAEAGKGKMLLPRLPSLFEAPDFSAHQPGGIFESDEVEIETGELSDDRIRGENQSRRSWSAANEHSREFVPSDELPREPGALPKGANQPRARVKMELLDQGERDAGQPHALAPGMPIETTEPFGLEEAHLKKKQTQARVSEQALRTFPPEGQDPDAGRWIHPSLSAHSPEMEISMVDPGRSPKKTGTEISLEESNRLENWSGRPTVHISIGRIDVRAVTAGAPPPARPSAAQRPKLTLDEYLRQRNEGKR